jgi:hypothetical protein
MLWRKKNVHVCLNTVMSYRNQNMFSIYKQQIDTMLWHWNDILTRNDEKNTNYMGHLHSDLKVFTSTIDVDTKLLQFLSVFLTWNHGISKVQMTRDCIGYYSSVSKFTIVNRTSICYTCDNCVVTMNNYLIY